jgi:hypothetical protein
LNLRGSEVKRRAKKAKEKEMSDRKKGRNAELKKEEQKCGRKREREIESGIENKGSKAHTLIQGYQKWGS